MLSFDIIKKNIFKKYILYMFYRGRVYYIKLINIIKWNLITYDSSAI